MIIETLWHFRGFHPGEVLNAERHHGKFLGAYRTEAEAAAAIRQLADQEGFRDHPDGYRLFPFEVDRTYWAQGFRHGAPQDDAAIARDSSGIFGNDDALKENTEDTERDLQDEAYLLNTKPQPDQPDDFWELSHYKISAVNGQPFEDMGYKLVGFYTTRANLDAAIRHLSAMPGFRDHPDGFRINWVRIGDVYWKDGFA